jgi:hypothetical protein
MDPPRRSSAKVHGGHPSSEPHGLERLDPLASPQALKDGLLVVEPVRWDDCGDRPAYDLSGVRQ